MACNFTAVKLLLKKLKHHLGLSETLVNQLLTSIVANDQQSKHKMPATINDFISKLPTAPTEEQSLIQNIKSTFSSTVIPKKKNIVLFSDSIPRRMKMKHLNPQVNKGRIYLKSFLTLKPII